MTLLVLLINKGEPYCFSEKISLTDFIIIIIPCASSIVCLDHIAFVSATNLNKLQQITTKL